MPTIDKTQLATTLLTIGLLGGTCAPAAAAVRIEGQVQAGGGPLASSTVTLWAASAGAPKQLAQTKTGSDGRFELGTQETPGNDVVLYLVAKGGEPAVKKGSGDNPAIGLLTVLGSNPPPKVVVNEMTTVASVWTNAQFLDGTALKGHALGLRIAAGNVPNFVDLATGGWGEAVLGPLNSTQTPTMANFATLANLLAGCTTRVSADACDKLFAAAAPPTGGAPTDMLMASESIARNNSYHPERLFALLDAFYPVPEGKPMRPTPFLPYLSYSPSAWVLPLKFVGGGLRGAAKIMIDSEGNAWTGDNFVVGSQAVDSLWNGNLSKFAPNGRALSPSPTGFAGGGLLGPGFGTSIDADDNVWITSMDGKSISLFDKNGKPLSPPEGYNFNGQLGKMQGVIVTPSRDVWVLGMTKNQLVYFPEGDPSKGKLVCEGSSAEPCRSMSAPFQLAIDQQDRIWVSNSGGNTVVRFPASDPSKVQSFKVGYNASGLAIDSKGNVWVPNRLGSSERGRTAYQQVRALGTALMESPLPPHVYWIWREGSVTLLRPDGSEAPDSPFTGGGLPSPFAAAVDGNDNVWISNFAGDHGRIAHLCGVRTETCRPGMKTGDQISPPGGYVGGGLESETDIGVGPAGDVWVADNWQLIDSCYLIPSDTSEALSTRCGGQGLTVFYGMAKPVRTPLIGPPRQP